VSGSAFDVVGNYYPVDIPLHYRCWLYNDDIKKINKQVPHVIHGQGFPNFSRLFVYLSVAKTLAVYSALSFFKRDLVLKLISCTEYNF
jgi:hypothetical protein